MAKQGSLQTGDRVRVTLEGHSFEGQFGNVQNRLADAVVDVLLDGANEVPIFESDVTKVSPNAGMLTPDVKVLMTRDERTHALGAFTAYLVGRGTPAEELAEKVTAAATEWDLL